MGRFDGIQMYFSMNTLSLTIWNWSPETQHAKSPDLSEMFLSEF